LAKSTSDLSRSTCLILHGEPAAALSCRLDIQA
jgi:hypothetical protein